jgi:hypothetical protein
VVTVTSGGNKRVSLAALIAVKAAAAPAGLPAARRPVS